jgi:hypothetical protein
MLHADGGAVHERSAGEGGPRQAWCTVTLARCEELRLLRCFAARAALHHSRRTTTAMEVKVSSGHANLRPARVRAFIVAATLERAQQLQSHSHLQSTCALVALN